MSAANHMQQENSAAEYNLSSLPSPGEEINSEIIASSGLFGFI